MATNSLGLILVDSTGHTLYLFKATRAKSQCATASPPLLSEGTADRRPPTDRLQARDDHPPAHELASRAGSAGGY